MSLDREKRKSSPESIEAKNSLKEICDNYFQFDIIRNDDCKMKAPQASSGGYCDKPYFNETVNRFPSESSCFRMKWKIKCSTCYCSSAAFYCKDCVKNGNFYHSSLKLPERFAEKRLRERRLRQYIESLEEKVAAQLKGNTHYRKEALTKQIESLKEKIILVQKVIENEREKILKAHKEKDVLNYQISHLKKNIPRFQRKNSNILQNINLYAQRIPEKKVKISDLEGEFKEVGKDKVKALSSLIFPISKLPTANSCSEEDGDEEAVIDETMKEIEDASQTHYVRGRWITVRHFMHRRNYGLVSSVLPGSGDYTSFVRPQLETDFCERRAAQNICAGLTYLCQLVNNIASLLAIHLPKKLFFSDFSNFSKEEMKEQKFERLVLRLNANVLYLCASQGVPQNLLHPVRAMQNLVAFLSEEESEVGRMRSFEFTDCLVDALEEVACFYDDVADSDSEDDWEQLSNVALPEFPSSPPTSSLLRQRYSIDEGASGIVNSAASSVMSIFRGIGNPLK